MKPLHFIFVLVFAIPLQADIVTLTDGTKLEGAIKRDTGGWVVTDAAGKTTRVNDSQVKGIEKTGNLSPAALAETKLKGLRRQVEPMSDLNQIINLYSIFIDQNKNTPAAESARNELAVWKDRKDKGLVKVGGAWLTAAQQAEMLEKMVAAIEETRTLVKDGKFKEAAAAVDKLLALDAANMSGLYLRGIISFRQDQLGVAKKSFERVREISEDHGPTLNNLAVILWQQKQQVAAIPMYDLALNASPRNRRILDNVAEALYAMKDARETPALKKLAKKFQDQDGELQKQLKQEGLERWGSNWLTKEQMADVKKEQERVKAKLELLKQEYEKSKARIDELDRLIDINDRTMRRIRDDSTITDANGQATRTTLPSIYYQVKRQNDQLKDEQDTLIKKLDTFKDQEIVIWREGPLPPYTGKQQIIDVEGTPLGVPKSAPATKPVQ